MTSDKIRRVPLNVAQLRRALRASRLTPSDLSDRSDVSESTISEWLSGKRKKVSRSRLTLVAEALAVPVDLLTGTAEGPFPGLSPWHRHPVIEGSLFAVDEGHVVHEVDVETGDRRTPEYLQDAAYPVVWSGLAQRILEAIRRDLRNEVKHALEFRQGLRETLGSDEQVERRLVVVIQRLASVSFWRMTVLGGPLAPPFGPPAPRWRPLLSREEEERLGLYEEELLGDERRMRAAQRRLEAASREREESQKEWAQHQDDLAYAMRDAMLAALHPWLEGQAPLDYSAAHAVFWWALSLGGSPWDRARREERMRVAMKRRRRR